MNKPGVHLGNPTKYAERSVQNTQVVCYNGAHEEKK